MQGITKLLAKCHMITCPTQVWWDMWSYAAMDAAYAAMDAEEEEVRC